MKRGRRQNAAAVVAEAAAAVTAAVVAGTAAAVVAGAAVVVAAETAAAIAVTGAIAAIAGNDSFLISGGEPSWLAALYPFDRCCGAGLCLADCFSTAPAR